MNNYLHYLPHNLIPLKILSLAYRNATWQLCDNSDSLKYRTLLVCSKIPYILNCFQFIKVLKYQKRTKERSLYERNTIRKSLDEFQIDKGQQKKLGVRYITKTKSVFSFNFKSIKNNFAENKDNTLVAKNQFVLQML